MGVFAKSPLVVLNSVVVLLVCLFLNGAESRDTTCDIEIEATLRKLLTPQQSPSIQLQALRKDILRKFSEALQRIDEEDQENYKRSLAAWNNAPYASDKRNVEALARGGYIKTLPEDGEEDEDSNYKRSLASLAKNGQLPGMQAEEHKRGIESLARNGELPSSNKDMDREYYFKRNIGSLAKNYNLPSPGKRYLGSLARSGALRYKKNIQSIARDGGLSGNKRNVAALLRMEDYLNTQNEHQNGFTQKPRDLSADKRNLASIKAHYPKFKRSLPNEGRSKRQVYYDDDDDDYSSEFASPVYQNQNVNDYEELMRELTGAYPNTEKRFLGSVARSGWFRQPNSRFNQLRNTPEKRHIGSLARLGWLPTLRNIRRFNRSGRSTDISDSCRETAKDGNYEDNSIAQDPYFAEVDKRFLLQPAVDNILLRKILHNPRSISS